ncbi:uncharacterized protein LOC129720576 [Wyeomyia smithii]|uniref:uncharacterized protein LOC129720576 n=1 Tax=Wyeomyia smithii TaxID=174621 RepID=UPI002467BC33|nr:uncharacterized protein LOC129720576 [Wyeomyia smithii]
MHTDQEIVEEMKDIHIIDVKRIKRHKGDQYVDSEAFILTFNLGTLPGSIDAGFHRCKVRQYVPPPLRCMNCLKFGHKKDQCKGNQVCANCASLYHDKTECQQKTTCVVCREDHHALSKNCPVYIDELEIQRLRVIEKITHREARQKRRSQAPDPNPPRLRELFSSQLKIRNNINKERQAENPTRDQRTERTERNSRNFNSSTQMNTRTSNLQPEDNSSNHASDSLDATATTQHRHQQQTEAQFQNDSRYSSINTGTTNTTNNMIYGINENTPDPNTTNSIRNLSNLSQAISQSIFVDEIDIDNI